MSGTNGLLIILWKEITWTSKSYQLSPFLSPNFSVSKKKNTNNNWWRFGHVVRFLGVSTESPPIVNFLIQQSIKSPSEVPLFHRNWHIHVNLTHMTWSWPQPVSWSPTNDAFPSPTAYPAMLTISYFPKEEKLRRGDQLRYVKRQNIL